ncbi:MAG: MerR family transcriptional regulator, partial [Burkholderiales bacterium]|nr:MerR family transcriptional regulator [Burkholderiales bacterium]
MLLKIGELASRTGLTIRTLHHYDKIGLLKPSARSEAGYRLYDRSDIKRLHHIQALRRLDLSLAEVGLSLLLKTNNEPNLEYWLSTLEMMSLIGKYFSRDEILRLRELELQAQSKVDTHMPPFIQAGRVLLDQKVPPSDPRAKQLAKKWVRVMSTIMPDPALLSKFTQMHRKEPSLQSLSGVDDEMIDFITKASIEVRYDIYCKYLSEEELQYFRNSFFKNNETWAQVFAEV